MITLNEANEALKKIYLDVVAKNIVPEEKQQYQNRRNEGWNEEVRESGKRLGVKDPVRKLPKIGRNQPCPCGSGKKYKKCCGKEEL